MNTFTPEQIENFRAYEKVRRSGRFNVFDPRARAKTGLSGEEYGFVMAHYSELLEAEKKSRLS